MGFHCERGRFLLEVANDVFQGIFLCRVVLLDLQVKDPARFVLSFFESLRRLICSSFFLNRLRLHRLGHLSNARPPRSDSVHEYFRLLWSSWDLFALPEFFKFSTKPDFFSLVFALFPFTLKPVTLLLFFDLTAEFFPPLLFRTVAEFFVLVKAPVGLRPARLPVGLTRDFRWRSLGYFRSAGA